MVGLIVGSGIFRVPSAVAGQVESVGAIALLWALGGVIALCGSLTIAELACLYPEAGGVYVFLRQAYGPLAAFLYGWTRLFLLVPASIGAIALIFGSYAGAFLHLGPSGERPIAAALIVALAALNYRSLVWGAGLVNVVTLAKVAALATVAVTAFIFGSPERGAFAEPLAFAPATWPGFGLALVTVMWAYSGWSSVVALAGEVKHPERTLPRALAGGIVLVIVVYLATNGAYLYLLSVTEIANSPQVASDAATRVFGAWGSRIVAVLVALSTFGAVQAALMFNPRIFYAMASDGLLFGPVGHVHQRFLTPHVATVFTAVLGIAYLSLRSFEQLAQAFILGVWPFHILMVWAVFRLRRLRPDLPRPFRTPGYPVVPAAFLVASGAMVLNAFIQQTALTLFGFALILAGVPVFLLIQRRTGRGSTF
jgi:amino acid transporter